jgi:hypothetical protein
VAVFRHGRKKSGSGAYGKQFQVSLFYEINNALKEINESLGSCIHDLLPCQKLHLARRLNQRLSCRFKRQRKQNGKVGLSSAEVINGIGPVPHNRENGSLHRLIQGFLSERDGREKTPRECRSIRTLTGSEGPGKSMDILAENNSGVPPGTGESSFGHGHSRLGERF